VLCKVAAVQTVLWTGWWISMWHHATGALSDITVAGQYIWIALWVAWIHKHDVRTSGGACTTSVCGSTSGCGVLFRMAAWSGWRMILRSASKQAPPAAECLHLVPGSVIKLCCHFSKNSAAVARPSSVIVSTCLNLGSTVLPWVRTCRKADQRNTVTCVGCFQQFS
jgi:hypothetical protein